MVGRTPTPLCGEPPCFCAIRQVQRIFSAQPVPESTRRESDVFLGAKARLKHEDHENALV
jgi:hypothetical protein